uniref:CCHC-type domain-containing protein n=1 Tax=Plectus sambesii TaxID=2011161 RepID=A0A914WTU2_9BILA
MRSRRWIAAVNASGIARAFETLGHFRRAVPGLGAFPAATLGFKEEACRNCNKKGHIAAICQSTPSQQRQQSSGKKRDNRQPHKSHQVSIDFIKIGKTAAQMTMGQVANLKTYQASIKVNRHNMLLEFNTGAAATVISEADWNLMGKPPLLTT